LKNANFSPKIGKKWQEIVIITSTPGGNPTIVSYNVSAVKINNDTSSLPSAFKKSFILPKKML
jgi:hypothetical protein